MSFILCETEPEKKGIWRITVAKKPALIGGGGEALFCWNGSICLNKTTSGMEPLS